LSCLDQVDQACRLGNRGGFGRDLPLRASPRVEPKRAIPVKSGIGVAEQKSSRLLGGIVGEVLLSADRGEPKFRRIVQDYGVCIWQVAAGRPRLRNGSGTGN